VKDFAFTLCSMLYALCPMLAYWLLDSFIVYRSLLTAYRLLFDSLLERELKSTLEGRAAWDLSGDFSGKGLTAAFT